MPGRTNHPFKTLLLLAVVVGSGYLAYEYLWVRKVLATPPAIPTLEQEKRDEMRKTILDRYEADPCFVDVGPMSYRFKEGRWRIDLHVADGCSDEARTLCLSIHELLDDEFHLTASVWAYDGAGREMAHYVP